MKCRNVDVVGSFMNGAEQH